MQATRKRKLRGVATALIGCTLPFAAGAIGIEDIVDGDPTEQATVVVRRNPPPLLDLPVQVEALAGYQYPSSNYDRGRRNFSRRWRVGCRAAVPQHRRRRPDGDGA